MAKAHGVALSTVFMFCLAVPALAQFNRTAVSTTGNDANNCTIATPCRSFDRAMMMTNSGGEVIALDSGGYGPFVVNKAVIVQAAPGVYAGITVTTPTEAILVIAGAGDVVELRGLTVRSLNSSGLAYGVYYQSGSAVHIHDMIVVGTANTHGIFASLTAAGEMYVWNTLVRGVDIGVFFGTSSGIIKGSVDNTHVENVSNGAYYVSDNARVTISNSVASGSGLGFRLLPFSNTTSELNMESCISSNNFVGLLADAGAGTSTMRVSNSMVTNNDFGILISGGGVHNVLSFGNNRLAGNTTPGAFTGGLSQQ